jgi:hypothetical protein
MAFGARKHKYNAKPTVYKGVTYGSKAEAKRAAELDLLLRAGKVAWWLRQVPFDVGEPGVDKPYRVDFLVGEWGPWVDERNRLLTVHAEDVKGCDTPSFRRHVKQWRKRGPMPLHVIRGRKVEVIPRGVDYGTSGRDEGEGGETQGQGGADAGGPSGRPEAADGGGSVRRARRHRPQAADDD